MKIKDCVPLGDYDEGGSVDAYCSLCGHGFEKKVPGSNNNGHYSKRKIKVLIHAVFTIKNLDYSDKPIILKEIYDKCHTYNEVLDFISKRLEIPESFLRHRM